MTLVSNGSLRRQGSGLANKATSNRVTPDEDGADGAATVGESAETVDAKAGSDRDSHSTSLRRSSRRDDDTGPGRAGRSRIRNRGGRPGSDPVWRSGDAAEVARRALAVLVLIPVLFFGLGLVQGESHVSRSEFVYSLDGSVPDGFLREDRRLLTQIVTFTSDAVLGPVADEYGMDIDDLRAKIDVETVDLSEVLRLDVRDADAATALELNRAVLDQYLRTVNGENNTSFSQDLVSRRRDLVADLDTARAEAADDQVELTTMAEQAGQLERRIALLDNRLDRLSALEEQGVAGGAVSQSAIASKLSDTATELSDAEAELVRLRVDQIELEARVGEGSETQRTIDRLETDLNSVEAELSRRELDPVVGSSLRELSPPTVITRSRTFSGLRMMAIGLLLAIPLAAWVGYRTRRRQLWLP